MTCVDKNANIYLLLISAVGNAFRIHSLQRMYMVMDDLKFHSYHSTRYTGVVKDLIDFMRMLQNNFWTFLGFLQSPFFAWLQEPFDLPSYASFTNSKFLYVERTDSFYYNNTKDYYVVFVPFMLICFLIANKLFIMYTKCKLKLKCI